MRLSNNNSGSYILFNTRSFFFSFFLRKALTEHDWWNSWQLNTFFPFLETCPAYKTTYTSYTTVFKFVVVEDGGIPDVWHPLDLYLNKQLDHNLLYLLWSFYTCLGLKTSEQIPKFNFSEAFWNLQPLKMAVFPSWIRIPFLTIRHCTMLCMLKSSIY